MYSCYSAGEHRKCWILGDGRETSHKACTLTYLIYLKYPEQTAN